MHFLISCLLVAGLWPAPENSWGHFAFAFPAWVATVLLVSGTLVHLLEVEQRQASTTPVPENFKCVDLWLGGVESSRRRGANGPGRPVGKAPTRVARVTAGEKGRKQTPVRRQDSTRPSRCPAGAPVLRRWIRSRSSPRRLGDGPCAPATRQARAACPELPPEASLTRRKPRPS